MLAPINGNNPNNSILAKQTNLEELLNAITHGIGIILGVVGLYVMLKYCKAEFRYLFSVGVYGTSIIILFTASTLYHAIKKEYLKKKFRILDHISIYLLIAGSYTPVTLISLKDSLGWVLFYAVWSIAIFGAFLKLFFTGRFEIFSTLLYLLMGWLIIFDFSNLSRSIGTNGLFWLFAGGLSYTVGIIFYAINKIPFHHVIWHLFVLVGAVCHFILIFNYIIKT